MYVVVDREGRVLARTGRKDRAHKIQRMARSIGRTTLVHDTREPRERALFGKQVRVVITGRKERYFGEAPAAAEWANRHLKQKMTVGAMARFYRGNGSQPYAVLRLTERGVVVTKGAGIGNVV